MMQWIGQHWEAIAILLGWLATVITAWYKLNLKSTLSYEQVKTLTQALNDHKHHCLNTHLHVNEHLEDRTIHVESDQIAELRQLIIENRNILSAELGAVRQQIFELVRNSR